LVKKFGASSEFLVQKFIKGGQEIIIGGKRDPNFGPIILFGMGGVFTEVLHDISLRICPINRREALNMIQETKGASILKDTKIIVEVLLKVSLLLYSNQEVKELDINPLIVTKKGPVAVDALIIL
jgi:altronate dehydratase